jgi:hypothetical protein
MPDSVIGRLTPVHQPFFAAEGAEEAENDLKHRVALGILGGSP